ncbi:MAG: tetratricopeptide repeat protein [bacterium]
MNKMKKYKIFVSIAVLFIMLTSAVVNAQDETELFQKGNQLYREGEFLKAVDCYLEIYEQGYESGHLYYNIGNCYYKLHKIGKAVLFYERAKKLMPRDEDLQFNLKLVNLSVVDKIEPLPAFFLFRLFNGFFHLVPKPFLVWIVAALYLFFIFFLIIRNLSQNESLRRLYLRIIIIFLVLLVVFGFSLFKQITDETKQDQAVIMAGEVDIKSAPSETATTLFSLHEGTKVHIDKESGDWYEIVLADGKVGWVEKEILEKI